MDKWRFLDSGYGDPHRNMAFDRALFGSYLPAESRPVFRIYQWDKPAISLGRFQKAEKVLNLESCRKDNISIVKRITGGGAIYHNRDELTYSLVCAAKFFPASSVKDSYQKITNFILKTYRSLGFFAQYAKDCQKRKKELGAVSDFCFSGWQDYDILIDGKKIGGNAQKRKRAVIFQHGSIPFTIPTNIDNYFLRPIQNKKDYLCLSKIGFTNLDKLKKVLLGAFKGNLNQSIDYAAVSC
ncbi:MAG: lipoate--protein ligase family protein [Candidatus Omnitrophica bacterium]|nr:lipoate--protein ligase family protein [Candidatus Omnitrophota bacterium]MCF7878947.1 lipoate--protein ligase family protein [Candidatus Omnitrophota bacterium]